MKTQDLKKTILKVTKRKNVEKLEWDSLSHLNILIELEKKLPGKLDKITTLSNATSYQKLYNCLKKSRLIKD
jgi:acyl carrier protein